VEHQAVSIRVSPYPGEAGVGDLDVEQRVTGHFQQPAVDDAHHRTVADQQHMATAVTPDDRIPCSMNPLPAGVE